MVSDEQLALNLQHGQVSALDELVGRYAQALVGYLYRLAGADRFLAEDLMQESFMRVFRQIHQYQYPRPFKPWLYAIATNLVHNHYNLADTWRTLDDPLREDVLQHEDLVEKIVERQELLSAVARCLQELPMPQREVILLRYIHDFSISEISESLDVPIGTVKSRLLFGIRGLRARYQREIGEER